MRLPLGLLIVCVCCLAKVSQTFAENVVYGADVFPPHVLFDKTTNKCVGKNIDDTVKIVEQAGHNVSVLCAPAVRLVRLLIEGKIDFIVKLKGAGEVENHVKYSDIPSLYMDINLYQHLDTQNTEDLVAAVRGFAYEGQRNILIEQNYRFFDLPDSITVIDFFLKKRSQYMLSYGDSLDYFLQKNEIILPDSIVSQTLKSSPAFYAVSNQSDKQQVLLKVINDYAKTHGLVKYIDM